MKHYDRPLSEERIQVTMQEGNEMEDKNMQKQFDDLESRVALIEKTIHDFLGLGMAVNKKTLSEVQQTKTFFAQVIEQMKRVEEVIEAYQISTATAEGLA